MKKLKIIIQFIIFAVIILLCNKVNAASINLSPNKSSVTVGDEFTISMNLSGASLASLNVKITVDTSKVEYISSNEPNNTNFNNGRILYTWTDASGGSNPKTDGTIVTFRLKAKSAGEPSFSVSGNFYDTNENSINLSLSGTSIKINEKEVLPPPLVEETPDNNENNGGTPEPPQQPPTNEENNQPPNNNQNTNQLSSNAYLSSLQVNVEGISPRFNKNTTKYYLTIENTIDTIKVNATPEDNNARVEVTGNTNLQIGSNTITIIVTAQDGVSKRNYLIEVTKTDDPNNVNTNLENLAIENVTLNPEFSADILEYSASVGSNIESLNILAVPQIEGANVKITGGDKLAFGNNVIIITVTAKNGSNIKNYTVNVYRKTEAEEIEERNALLEEANVENNIINEDINITNINNRTRNVMLWILFVILMFSAIGIIIYLVWKKKKG